MAKKPQALLLQHVSKPLTAAAAYRTAAAAEAAKRAAEEQMAYQLMQSFLTSVKSKAEHGLFYVDHRIPDMGSAMQAEIQTALEELGFEVVFIPPDGLNHRGIRISWRQPPAETAKKKSVSDRTVRSRRAKRGRRG